MPNSIATRLTVSSVLGAIGLIGIVALVWNAMRDVEGELEKFREKSEILGHVGLAETDFGIAQRAAMTDLRGDNFSLRTYARDHFVSSLDHLGMVRDSIADSPDTADAIELLQAGVGEYATIYEDAVAVKRVKVDIALALHRRFIEAEDFLVAMEDTDTLAPGDPRFFVITALREAFETTHELTRQPNYRDNLALLDVMLSGLAPIRMRADQIALSIPEDLAPQLDGFRARIDAVEAAITALKDADRALLDIERGRLDVMAPRIYTEYAALVGQLRDAQDVAGANALAQSVQLRNRAIGIASLAVAVIVLVTMVNVVAIVRPMRQFVEATRNLAEGKSAGRLPKWRRDEFGALAQSVMCIDERGASARRIRDALDGSDMMLLVARRGGDLVYVSAPLARVQASHDGGGEDPIAWLSAHVPDIETLIAKGRDGTVSMHLGDNHYDIRIRPVAEGSAHAGFVLQMLDRTATRGLQADIARLVARLVAGDFSSRIAPQASGDALGEIGRDINRMCDSFERGFADVSKTVAALARGDLTHRMRGEYDGVFLRLQDDINRSLSGLAELVGDIRLTGEALAQHSGDVAEEADQLSRQTEMQAAALRQSSATMREMTNAISATSDRAGDLRALSTTTADGAAEAARISDTARSAMTEIESAAGRMRDIVEVIDAISFQTKLLALNAAVEAARAGKAGSGFAVVAAEVRHLADRAARSARDISDLITDSVQNVERGAVQVSRTGERLATIATSVGEMNRAIIAISTMSTDQSRSVEEVTAAISAMDDATAHQATLAEGGARRARSLQDSAERLRDLIAQFTLMRDEEAEVLPALPAPPSTSVATPARLSDPG